VRLFVQQAAEQDILRQVEWYAEKGLPHIARRFHAAVLDAIDALQAMPGAGPPKFFDNPLLAGLRSWSVKGFDDFRVYYLVQAETLTIVRVLHGKRDLGTILGSQELEEP
jgi:plasmid stabilization system protein ParE